LEFNDFVGADVLWGVVFVEKGLDGGDEFGGVGTEVFCSSVHLLLPVHGGGMTKENYQSMSNFFFILEQISTGPSQPPPN